MMTCGKCGGFMCKEKIYTEQGSLWLFRCVHCGKNIDPLITRNSVFGDASAAMRG